MNVLYSLLAVTIIILLALTGVGVAGLQSIFGVVIPYAAVAIFILGITYRVLKWARSPVPYRIPTTCGQQKSLSWIKANNHESPYDVFGVIKRMLLEVLLFRSLFRNTKTDLKGGPKIVYSSNKWLWLGGLAFHWAFFLILFRHFRFFTEPVPSFVLALEGFDGVFQIALPALYLTDVIIVAALTYLFLRRVLNPQIRYLSLANDFFPLFLLFSIVVTGILMRYFYRVDVVSIKELVIGLIGFNPVVPDGISTLFYLHLFLVSTLVAYIPFSKLTHMAGVFLSPTRNLANNSRVRRHINPWNYPVKVHTYEEWEEEFRDVLKSSGYPLERE